MKKTLAFALAATMTLGACKEEKAPQTEEQIQQAAADQYQSDQAYLDQYRITVDAPVSRNGQDFTVRVQALCNKIEKNDAYTAACEEAVTKAMREKFACSSYPLAPGATRSDNPAILSAGMTSIDKTPPAAWLYGEDKWHSALQWEKRAMNKNNIFVIGEIDDLGAATSDMTDTNRPAHCPSFY